MDIINRCTHKEIIAKLDYDAPYCPDCRSQMKKYDFQKTSKIPYLETTGMPTRILLKKRRFKCYQCSKMMVSQTSLVKKNHFLRYDRAVRWQVKIITMDIFSPYYALAKQLFPCAKIVLNRFHIVQNLSRAMSRMRVQIMNQFDRKSHEYKAIKRYWKLIQQDSRKLSDKRFYRPTFRMHLTNKEILDKLLSYSEDLKHHYNINQLLLFYFHRQIFRTYRGQSRTGSSPFSDCL